MTYVPSTIELAHQAGRAARRGGESIEACPDNFGAVLANGTVSWLSRRDRVDARDAWRFGWQTQDLIEQARAAGCTVAEYVQRNAGTRRRQRRSRRAAEPAEVKA